ncbi:hypothetical protein NL676_006502 [Syzygium grande]|nr:hypothetical protein NL676_006502 [Syzygium grande]
MCPVAEIGAALPCRGDDNPFSGSPVNSSYQLAVAGHAIGSILEPTRPGLPAIGHALKAAPSDQAGADSFDAEERQKQSLARRATTSRLCSKRSKSQPHNHAIPIPIVIRWATDVAARRRSQAPGDARKFQSPPIAVANCDGSVLPQREGDRRISGRGRPRFVKFSGSFRVRSMRRIRAGYGRCCPSGGSWADRRRPEVGELGGVGAEAVGTGIGSVAREVPQVYSAVSWSLHVRL